MLSNQIARLRALHNGRGVSQAHLARQIGVGRSFVNKIEKGKAQPSGEVMLKIAKYFKLPLETVFQLVGTPFQEIPLSQSFSRPSSGNGSTHGQIVAIRNGEGCGAPCRAVSQK